MFSLEKIKTSSGSPCTHTAPGTIRRLFDRKEKLSCQPGFIFTFPPGLRSGRAACCPPSLGRRAREVKDSALAMVQKTRRVVSPDFFFLIKIKPGGGNPSYVQICLSERREESERPHTTLLTMFFPGDWMKRRKLAPSTPVITLGDRSQQAGWGVALRFHTINKN